jgi:hypothetical protein
MTYVSTMEIEAKVQLNNLIRLRDDHLNWINAKIGDEIIIKDDTGKHGNFLSIWKKGE